MISGCPIEVTTGGTNFPPFVENAVLPGSSVEVATSGTKFKLLIFIRLDGITGPIELATGGTKFPPLVG